MYNCIVCRHSSRENKELAMSTIPITSHLVNQTTTTTSAFIALLQSNSTRSPLLSVLAQTADPLDINSDMAAPAPSPSISISPASPVAPSQGVGGGTGWQGRGTQSGGAGGVVTGTGPGEGEDAFGEHYFHICIYIWVFVVVSSLIALSVKWGCCGRSLTRWEVKKIPLKKFKRTEGEDCHDKCPICHESFHEGRLIRQLPCNHCYHSYCVDRWLIKMSNRCPLCKQRVSISLLCHWSKPRRHKRGRGGAAGSVAGSSVGSGGQGQISHAEADMDSSADEFKPLPPLSTLNPSSWYGEDIMSGPSKFVILRPGHPTRVIDVRDKVKVAASTDIEAQRSSRDCGTNSGENHGGLTDNDCCHSGGQGDGAGLVSNCSCNLEAACPSDCAHSTVEMDEQIPRNKSTGFDELSHEQDKQYLQVVDDMFLRQSEEFGMSARSSRSCSVSSDLPLLCSGLAESEILRKDCQEDIKEEHASCCDNNGCHGVQDGLLSLSNNSCGNIALRQKSTSLMYWDREAPVESTLSDVELKPQGSVQFGKWREQKPLYPIPLSSSSSSPLSRKSCSKDKRAIHHIQVVSLHDLHNPATPPVHPESGNVWAVSPTTSSSANRALAAKYDASSCDEEGQAWGSNTVSFKAMHALSLPRLLPSSQESAGAVSSQTTMTFPNITSQSCSQLIPKGERARNVAVIEESSFNMGDKVPVDCLSPHEQKLHSDSYINQEGGRPHDLTSNFSLTSIAKRYSDPSSAIVKAKDQFDNATSSLIAPVASRSLGPTEFDSCCVMPDLVLPSPNSDSSPKLVSGPSGIVLATLPTGNVLVQGQASPPLPPGSSISRKSRRRGTDYTCKHL